MKATALHAIVRPVHDLARARDFYRQALGFVPDTRPLPSGLPDALAEAWDTEPAACTALRLGEQTLVLVACDTRLPPPDRGADDPQFQHIAIVASDMSAAWQRLQAHAPAAITQGGPQQLPQASGGATAFKFRDPDGHPVELLAFAAASRPERWRGTAPGPTLGIDHSAITVADADLSIAFYTARLGLELLARQRNQGAEQARLDGLPAPQVDVVALAAGAAPHPHLELLGYHPARGTALHRAAPVTTTVWTAEGSDRLRDPDGHLHLLLPP